MSKTETEPTAVEPPPIPVDSLPGRGDHLTFEGRTYVIDERSLSVRDPQPKDTAWIQLDAGGNGALMLTLHAVQIAPVAGVGEPAT